MKKNKKNFDFIIIGVIALLFVLFLLPSGAFKYHNELSYKSNIYQMIFGFKDKQYNILNFNILGFLILIFMLSSIIIIILKSKIKKLTYILSGILLFISTILCLLLPKTINVEMTSTKELFIPLPFLYVNCIIMIIVSLLCLYKGIVALFKKDL